MDHVSLKVAFITAVNIIICGVIMVVLIRNAKAESLEFNKSDDSHLPLVEISKNLLSLSLPLLPYYISISAISQADRFIISRYLGIAELGKYSVGYSLGIAFSAVTSGITAALCPWIMRKVRAGCTQEILPILKKLTSLAAAAITFGISIFPEALSLLAPTEYRGALPIAFIAATVPLTIALTQCLTSMAIAMEKTAYSMLSGITAATIATVAGIIIIPRAGLVSAALITALSYNVLLILNASKIRHFLRIKLNFVNNYLQKMALIAVFAIAISEFSDHVFGRIFFCVSGFSAVIISLKSAVCMIKEKKHTLPI